MREDFGHLPGGEQSRAKLDVPSDLQAEAGQPFAGAPAFPPAERDCRGSLRMGVNIHISISNELWYRAIGIL